jgi:hypothetical protein
MANLLGSRPVPVRTCTVSFTSSSGIRHSTEVQAETLYEAAAMGLALLKKDGWTPPVGAATRIEVEVREPGSKHTLTVIQIERWLAGATTSPNERVKKDRLKTLLKGA